MTNYVQHISKHKSENKKAGLIKAGSFECQYIWVLIGGYL